MDPPTLSSDSVIETLLKTNRPPTEQEKAIVQKSMAPTNEKLQDVRGQISETVAHIEALKSQVQQAERKLERLLEDEAAILKTSEDHRRVLSAIRIIPEDVLREICIACVEEEMPCLSYRTTPLPYVLAQLSRGMRRIVLTTPVIWASMEVRIKQPNYYSDGSLNEQDYKALSRRVKEWFARSGGLPLTLFIKDPSYGVYRGDTITWHPSDILLDTLFTYSTRWKSIHFDATCKDLTTAILRVLALKAADVPILQSFTLRLEPEIPSSVLSKIAFLQISTLRRVSLQTQHVRQFPLNWAVLSSVSLNGNLYNHCYSKHEIVQILRQTKCLKSCYIVVRPPRPEDTICVDKITLPFLETLHISEREFVSTENDAPSLLDLISSPILADLCINATYLEESLLDFVKRSPNIGNLQVPYFEKDKSLVFLMALLRYCPLLTLLYLHPGPPRQELLPGPAEHDANLILSSFVEEGAAGVACPRLQYFVITGNIHFSLETFRVLLERKQKYTTDSNTLLPWKRVFIYISRMSPTETHQQIADFAAQKRTEGLDVDFFVEGMNTPSS